jgi:PIN domain nuclease of toxin-antitoxin system
VIPFDPDHALRLYGLPPHHRDPFDRPLIGTALAADIPLIGSDRQFKKYKGLKVICR